jgi:hypothetical protein
MGYMQTLYRVCYKRKDSPNWPEQTIDMKLETKESIVSEFGSVLNYLKKHISGGVGKHAKIIG